MQPIDNETLERQAALNIRCALKELVTLMGFECLKVGEAPPNLLQLTAKTIPAIEDDTVCEISMFGCVREHGPHTFVVDLRFASGSAVFNLVGETSNMFDSMWHSLVLFTPSVWDPVAGSYTAHYEPRRVPGEVFCKWTGREAIEVLPRTYASLYFANAAEGPTWTKSEREFAKDIVRVKINQQKEWQAPPVRC